MTRASDVWELDDLTTDPGKQAFLLGGDAAWNQLLGGTHEVDDPHGTWLNITMPTGDLYPTEAFIAPLVTSPHRYRIMSPLAMPEVPPQADVLPGLEAVRNQLGLTVDMTAGIIGASPRRFYEWRNGQPMPWLRLAVAAEASAVLESLVGERPQVIERLFSHTDSEAVGLIRSGRLLSFRAHLDHVRAEVLRELTPVATPLPLPAERDDEISPSDVLALVRSGALRLFGSLAQRLQPTAVDAAELWRIEAFAELDAAVAALTDGDELEDGLWTFLVTFDYSGLGEFHRRAQTTLHERRTTTATWRSFLAAEEAHAWAGYGHTEAAGEASTDGPETIDEGQDAVPAGLFDFGAYGLDLFRSSR